MESLVFEHDRDMDEMVNERRVKRENKANDKRDEGL